MGAYLHSIAQRGPILWLFIALIVTFLGTRIITRRIRGGSNTIHNWSVGGIHVHHQVFGILALIIAGCLEFTFRPPEPVADVLGAVFGFGIALTLDEFALWVYLDDVYWTKEGRASLDAVFVAVAILGMFLFGLTPFDISGDDLAGQPADALAVVWVFIVVLDVVPVVITALKGKLVLAVVGMFIWPLAYVGAIRLAKPRSPWARLRYHAGSPKRARAEARFGEQYQARWNWIRDLIGGAPQS